MRWRFHNHLVNAYAVHTQEETFLLSSCGTALGCEGREPVSKGSYPPTLGALMLVRRDLSWCHGFVAGAEGARRRECRQLGLGLLTHKVVRPFSPFPGYDNPLFGCRVLPYLRHVYS
jgi:hypothetical protein